MKSPADIQSMLARQWHNPRQRAARLLERDAWPLRITIGKPSATDVANSPEQVRAHLSAWREVSVGEVSWEQVNYRHLTESLRVPRAWTLYKPSEWISAIADATVAGEFNRLSGVIASVDGQYHKLLVQKFHLFQQTPATEIITAVTVASQLQPGEARGVPLRALNIAGIDSKFFERNRRLMTALLDLRFDGSVSEMGLETFLDAPRGSDQWLMLADLDSNLLPFNVVRVRDSELTSVAPPGSRLLVVENEKCLHTLPRMEQAIAILGAGLNLAWMSAPWLQSRPVAYWGDIDTWGLTMLARAREWVPRLTPILMSEDVFNAHASRHAVAEPTPAGDLPPAHLTPAEQSLYRQLLTLEHGRLEQEFLPATEVKQALSEWTHP
ncbi:MAG: Wadjet anti-phage system protein JetD domain-containing protein [Pseudomonadota bacterium]